MYIQRILKEQIIARLQPNKVVVLKGPRRVGKTILLKEIVQSLPANVEFLNGEDLPTQDFLSRRSIAHYKIALAEKKYLIIDEAQKVPGIGETIKLIVDSLEGIHVIISGSSSFDIQNQTGEPLTGRSISFMLYPLSEQEVKSLEKETEQEDHLLQRLVYGNYPELTSIPSLQQKGEYLRELTGALLMKDILSLENIRNSAKLFNLLRLIAFQVGSEVSYHELGQQLAMSKNTVERYLDLLSKVFIIYKVEGYSKNLRKEIVKNSRWYFVDNGIRNAVIGNFTPFSQRGDAGKLWENYIIAERLKFQAYQRMAVNNFFWRTYDQQEIDWVEEREGKLFGYEMKWSPRKIKPPSAWIKNYPEAEFEVITKENYVTWLAKKSAETGRTRDQS